MFCLFSGWVSYCWWRTCKWNLNNSASWSKQSPNWPWLRLSCFHYFPLTSWLLFAHSYYFLLDSARWSLTSLVFPEQTYLSLPLVLCHACIDLSCFCPHLFIKEFIHSTNICWVPTVLGIGYLGVDRSKKVLELIICREDSHWAGNKRLKRSQWCYGGDKLVWVLMEVFLQKWFSN